MKIEGIIWLRTVIDKLAFKHHVDIHEVEELFAGEPKFRYVEKGERKDENIYMALGQSEILVGYLHSQNVKRGFDS